MPDYSVKEKIVLGGLVFLITLFGLGGCLGGREPEPLDTQNIGYSFFVAGHVYGKPSYLYKADESYGGEVHPPFREKFDFIRNYPGMQFGVLVGDIVKKATAENWDKVDSQLAVLDRPAFFAAGNHDLSDRGLFEARYGRTYFGFRHENDLFIILDPDPGNGNITSEQLDFLDSCLTGPDSIGHVFVFFHQVLWWNEENKYRYVEPNSTDGRADTINFWTDVEPKFRALDRDVYLFCGDVGAHPTGESFMYDHYANIYLIATGMGGGKRDNFVIISVLVDGTVIPRLIALNDENIDALGRLETSSLPTRWSRWWNKLRYKLTNL